MVKNNILFLLLLLSIKSAPQESVEQVKIIPLGKVDSSYVKSVRNVISTTFKSEVEVLNSLAISDSLYGKIDGTLLNGKIYSFVQQIYNYPDCKSIIITEKPISYVPWSNKALSKPESLPFVFRGHAKEIGGNIGIISTFKILRENKGDEKLFNEMFQKVIIHEYSDLLGIEHCSRDSTCVMVNGLNFQNATDIFCDFCNKKVKDDLQQ